MDSLFVCLRYEHSASLCNTLCFLLYREVSPQLNWACEGCGRVFGRRYSAQRHVRLKHDGRAIVIDYPSYLVRVLSGRSDPPETIHPVNNDRRRSVFAFDLDNLWDRVQKEFEERMAQRIVDVLDPMKAAGIYTMIADTLLLQKQHAPKAALVGFRASVCKDCLKGYIQSIYSWGSLATGFSFTNLPEHECIKKDLESAKHVDKTLEMQIIWKKLEEDLINIVGKWGKSKKLLLSVPSHDKEEEHIDLGIIEEGHWAQRGTKGATMLTEQELQDFLRRAHATEGTFRLTFRGEIKLLTMILVSEWKSASRESLSQRKRVVGYKGHICEHCLTAEALEVYFDGKELSERKHECDPARISRADLFNTEGTIRHPSDELPRILLESVKGWAKDRKYLQAFKVERSENYIDLSSVRENHWAARAIKGRTILNDAEILDFLKKAKATFGIFKVKKGKVEHFYHMMISDIPSKIIK